MQKKAVVKLSHLVNREADMPIHPQLQEKRLLNRVLVICDGLERTG